MQVTFQWEGHQALITNLGLWGEQVQRIPHMVLEYYQPVLETYMKENAPWTDRTGNARQSLYTELEDLAKDIAVLYLAHGMEYGLWLEVRWAGRWSVIWPTIAAHLDEIGIRIQRMLN